MNYVRRYYVDSFKMINGGLRTLLGLCMAAAAVALPNPAAFGEPVGEWATVGDAGNAPDANGKGAVPYVFRISKTELTIGEYTTFLNAVAASDPYGLYNPRMGDYQHVLGIARSGSPGSYTYSAMAPAGYAYPGASSPTNRPMTFVSWFDAARYANWMHNGQGSGGTEDGAYTLNGMMSGAAPVKNTSALFFLPTTDEWYKAAYYKSGGTNSGYWKYATQSDVQPGNVIGNDPNQANYFQIGRVSVTGQSSLIWNQNYLTDVGAFTGSSSAYGTFDQTGSVQEFTDLDGSSTISRGLPSGEWDHYVNLDSSNGSTGETGWESHTIGFRLASSMDAARISGVPEIDPATGGSALSLVAGVLAMIEQRRRRGKLLA